MHVHQRIHADADGQVAPKTTLVASLDALRQRHEAASGTFCTLEEVLQDTYGRRGRRAK